MKELMEYSGPASEVVIPDSVTRIGIDAFADCPLDEETFKLIEGLSDPDPFDD